MGLEASLLGGFRLIYDGGLVTAIHQPRQQALLHREIDDITHFYSPAVSSARPGR